MYSENELGTQDTQANLVGMEFIAGSEGNAQIAEALGFIAMRFPNGEIWQKPDDDLDDRLVTRTPDYCMDDVLCIELLEERGIHPLILSTIKPKRARVFEPGFVAVFELKEILYITAPMPTEEAAAACALWCAIGISHD